MPKKAEKQIARQGGVERYRMLQKYGHSFVCAVTKQKGPKGGRTVCWKRK